MNEYTYDEINIGLSHEFTVTVTQQMQDMFKKVSGDVNPLHADSEFAANRGFDSTVVFGMLTSSFYSTLVGVYLPGKNCLFHSIDIKFTQPVFIGDTLTVSGTVKEINDMFRQITVKAAIVNQHGRKVSKAIIKTGVLDE